LLTANDGTVVTALILGSPAAATIDYFTVQVCKPEPVDELDHALLSFK